MRLVSLRLALIAGAGLAALAPVARAQEAPPPVEAPAAPPAPAPAPAPVEEVAPPIPAIWSPAPVDAQERSAYGLYLSGRMANLRGDRATAAIFLTETEALTPEQPTVRDEAFVTTLFSGDLGVAARLAPQGEDASPLLAEAGRLADAVQTWADGDPRAAEARIAARPIAEPHRRAGAFLAPWLAAAAGDWTTALKPLSGAPTDPTSLFLRHERALLLEQRGRYPEADAEFKALVAIPVGAAFRVSYGGFLERRGRRDEALAQYDALMADPTTDTAATRAKANLQAGGRPPAMLSFRQGAAESLYIAALQVEAEGGHELAAVYLRMALALHPDDGVQLELGQALAKARLESSARDAFVRVSNAQPAAYAASRREIGQSFARDDQPELALAAFREAHAALPQEPVVAYDLAQQLYNLKHYDEALGVLNLPMFTAEPQLFEVRFLRGATLQALERHDEAEAELWAALQLRPDDPAALNSLGYFWVDSGRRVDQGAQMLARAHAAEPGNGNIQDSLGWAQYRQGQYETAVATLEEAVAKEPANAEIVDHLGDAYWQVGRRREAGWQWNRVLTLEPDVDRRAEVEKKLADGLAPPTPVAAS